MLLLAVTADTWIVTGLGFGIVLVLLFCLVFILQFFGWTMQRIDAPKAPKQAKAAPAAPAARPTEPAKKDEPTQPIEPSEPSIASDDDAIAAVAYALYLARDVKHDIPTAMITLRGHETAWNTKSIGLNNIGF